MKSIYGKALLTALMSITLFALPAHAVTKHVNCDEGEAIGDVLETAKGTAALLEVDFTGICNETITIRRDHVWITGIDDAVINGTVRVFSANDVRFTDVTITGPGDGLVAAGNSAVVGRNLTLAYNEGDNLNIRRSALVRLTSSRIIGDCESIYDEDCSDGAVIDAATFEVWRTSISNARYGITAETGSRVILDTRNGITDVFDNSVVGVQVAFNSIVDLRGETRIYGNRYNAIYALQGSGVRITSPSVTVDGFIACEDPLWTYLANREHAPVQTNCWW